MGYHRAGFDRIVGVDNRPQPRYAFEFVQADALEYVAEHGREFDVIHASPPCQKYSIARKIHVNTNHPDLVAPTRELLEQTGKMWVIENVVGAPLINPILLCGTMFDLKVYRHRLFESNCFLFSPGIHPTHKERTGAHRGYSRAHAFACVAGHNFQRDEGAKAMGIDWMGPRRELAQANPPAYTEYIGRQLIRILEDG